MFDQLLHVGSSGPEIQLAFRLLVAVFLGSLMGFQRSILGKHAGIRTYGLVSLGSSMFVSVGTLASFQLSMFAAANPMQIASSVVIGIGFIGSGLAAFRNTEHPGELTTASGIWVAAGVGMACGYGFYILAITSTALTFAIFSAFSYLERGVQRHYGIESR